MDDWGAQQEAGRDIYEELDKHAKAVRSKIERLKRDETRDYAKLEGQFLPEEEAEATERRISRRYGRRVRAAERELRAVEAERNRGVVYSGYGPDVYVFASWASSAVASGVIGTLASDALKAAWRKMRGRLGKRDDFKVVCDDLGHPSDMMRANLRRLACYLVIERCQETDLPAPYARDLEVYSWSFDQADYGGMRLVAHIRSRADRSFRAKVWIPEEGFRDDRVQVAMCLPVGYDSSRLDGALVRTEEAEYEGPARYEWGGHDDHRRHWGERITP